MKIFRFLLILCLPAFLLSPIPILSQEISAPRDETSREIFIPRDAFGKVCPWELFRLKNLSIEKYSDFIGLLENEEFLGTLTEEEFDDVVDFMILMVRYSVPKDDLSLQERVEEEIEELLYLLYEDERDEQQELYFTITLPSGFKVAIPLPGNPQMTYCLFSGIRRWSKKKLHHACHYVSKHRKPLITAAVVAGVIAAALLTGGVGASSAAAVGGGLVSAASNDDHPKAPPLINKPGEVVFQDDLFLEPSYSAPSLHTANSPSLMTPAVPLDASYVESIIEICYDFAENTEAELGTTGQADLLNDVEASFFDKAKEVTRVTASFFAHKAHDIASEATKLHSLLGASGVVASQTWSGTTHDEIDLFFGTNLAPMFTPEAKAELAEVEAMLPTLEPHSDLLYLLYPCPVGLIGATEKVAIGTEIAKDVVTVLGKAMTKGAGTGALVGIGRALATVGAESAVGSAIVGVALTRMVPSGNTPIVETQATSTIGWKVGDPVNNLTSNGNVPQWSTVRARHWKNKAMQHANWEIDTPQVYEATEANIARMEKGFAPQVESGEPGKLESVELHHDPAQRDGGLFDFIEVTPKQHSLIDQDRHLRGR